MPEAKPKTMCVTDSEEFEHAAHSFTTGKNSNVVDGIDGCDGKHVDPTNTPLRFTYCDLSYEARFDLHNCRTEVWQLTRKVEDEVVATDAEEPIFVVEHEHADEHTLACCLDAYAWGLITGRRQGRRDAKTELRNWLEVR